MKTTDKIVENGRWVRSTLGTWGSTKELEENTQTHFRIVSLSTIIQDIN